MKVNQPRIGSLDEACAYLKDFAQVHGLKTIEVAVLADGRVAIVGLNYERHTVWTANADTLLGSALSSPSVALAERLTEAGRAELARTK